MKWIILILALFCLPFVAAQSWSTTSSEIIIDVNISSGINIINPENIDFLRITSTYFPKTDERQQVQYESFYPKQYLKKEGDKLYEFTNLNQQKIKFGFNSRVKNKQFFKNVNGRIPYPLADIPPEYNKYTQPTETIDLENIEVKRLAHELAQGEDDLYELVGKIALWVGDNIEYNLDISLDKDAQKASEILLSREGVCREYSNLFIALLRSLGIPVKYISGIAYTDVEYFEYDWGAHAWTEVYFPGVGWIPFDPTYKQYGYIDPSHIKLQEAVDSAEESISFQWKANKATLEFDDINATASLISVSGELQNMLTMTAQPLFEEVGPGSYNAIIVNITNNNGFYSIPLLTVANVEEIELLSPNPKGIVLKPHETKQLIWKIKATTQFEKGFLYTIPIEMYSIFNDRASSSYKLSHDYKIYREEEVDQIISTQIQVKEEKEVEYFCNPKKEAVHEALKTTVICDIKKNIKDPLFYAKLCIEETCKTIDITRNEVSVEMEILANKTNYQTTLTYNETTLSTVLILPLKDKPNLVLKDIVLPPTIAYEDEVKITFSIEKISQYDPKNVKVSIDMPYETRTLSIEKITKKTNLALNFKGENLKIGENVLKFTLIYEDEEGNTYKDVKEVKVSLDNVSILQKMTISIRNVIRGIIGLFR